MEPPDEALVLACRRGDADAWEALIARYQRLIYAIPSRAGLDAELSAEVFQNVFATLLKNLDRIEQPSRIRAWLVTAARRATWRLIRRNRNVRSFRESEDAEDEINEIPDGAALPEDELVRLQEQHIIRTGVAALDERCRRLLTLLYYGPSRQSYEEIAAALDMSVGSIGPIRARCLQKLRRLLEDRRF